MAGIVLLSGGCIQLDQAQESVPANIGANLAISDEELENEMASS
jgi:hypothetical protein